ncbi:uncharacterized protein EAE97_002766 [Botrytis byssoidea]|uniref:Yeast cell wall synthesis Kre9/Knh1-like N-terminal domain-containing protein n=1 Tax=Botrytis byssoidea TaxID=139641 RepID=A0A9P5M8Y7_9HELO|nr:uncharacterized protein EAE97_002766 [Botrytis byssoidea]KAF7951215.1 hypothetical protein EAE97_002766 [Botrytis byssoidea]
MILYFHVICVLASILCLLVHSSYAIELKILAPSDRQILISGSNYAIKWHSRQSGTTNLTLMRMVTDSGVGGSILEIASNVPLLSGEFKWTVPTGLDINNVHFPPWVILGDCEGDKTLSGAFWVNDFAVYKRDDSSGIDKTTRYPSGTGNITVGTHISSTVIGDGSSSSTTAEQIVSTIISGNEYISSLGSVSGVTTGTVNITAHTHPTLFASSTDTSSASTNTPSSSNIKNNRMPMIVGIITGVLGLLLLVIVAVVIRHRDQRKQPLTLPWKMRSDKNALELETTANFHEMEGPGKFELDGTSMKKRVYELEGRGIKKTASVDVGD